MTNAIEVKNLCKKYKDFELNNISFELPKGSILGVIGTNGAGKTTTIKTILNITRKQSGEVKIFGLDSEKDDMKIKGDVGVVFDECGFSDILSAEKIDKIMKKVYENWDSPLFFSYIDEYELKRKQPLKEYSRGMKMKLSIAAALAHHPKLLILDEPTGGLDPVVRSFMLDEFLKFIEDGEHSILLSSHITTDLDKIADYILFIDNGKRILFDNKDNLIYNYCILKGEKSKVSELDSSDVLALRKNDCAFEALCSDKEAVKKKYPQFVCDTPTLEDIMVLVVRGEKR